MYKFLLLNHRYIDGEVGSLGKGRFKACRSSARTPIRQLGSGQWAGNGLRGTEPPWPNPPPWSQDGVQSRVPREPQPESCFPPWCIHKALRSQVIRSPILCEDHTHILPSPVFSRLQVQGCPRQLSPLNHPSTVAPRPETTPPAEKCISDEGFCRA